MHMMTWCVHVTSFTKVAAADSDEQSSDTRPWAVDAELSHWRAGSACRAR